MPSDDPDLLLSIQFFILTLDHLQSQKAYSESCLDILECFPLMKMLSYDQVKWHVSDLSGLIIWKHHICVDSCVGFTGPFTDLEECPCCHKPCYDQEKLMKSGSKNKVPEKVFTTFAFGPQLQAYWKSSKTAQKMLYWQDKTCNKLGHDVDDMDYVYDDIFCGSDYLEAVENGDINNYDMVCHCVSFYDLLLSFFTSFSSPLPNFLALVSHFTHSHPTTR